MSEPSKTEIIKKISEHRLESKGFLRITEVQETDDANLDKSSFLRDDYSEILDNFMENMEKEEDDATSPKDVDKSQIEVIQLGQKGGARTLIEAVQNMPNIEFQPKDTPVVNDKSVTTREIQKHPKVTDGVPQSLTELVPDGFQMVCYFTK